MVKRRDIIKGGVYKHRKLFKKGRKSEKYVNFIKNFGRNLGKQELRCIG